MSDLRAGLLGGGLWRGGGCHRYSQFDQSAAKRNRLARRMREESRGCSAEERRSSLFEIYKHIFLKCVMSFVSRRAAELFRRDGHLYSTLWLVSLFLYVSLLPHQKYCTRGSPGFCPLLIYFLFYQMNGIMAAIPFGYLSPNLSRYQGRPLTRVELFDRLEAQRSYARGEYSQTLSDTW